MEEDIKIIEDRVTTLKRHIKNYEESDCKTNVYQQLVKECKAIENLLKRYKELEEKNIEILQELLTERVTNKVISNNIINYQEELKNSIPISVIQNKIDEIDKELKDLTVCLCVRGNGKAHKTVQQMLKLARKNALQELLEERNK
jgi:hypothetical protein